MHAAVVTTFDAPPSYREFAEPTALGRYDVVADVVAAGLHRRVRSQADGSHYTSTGELPLVPGIDGVARLPDGSMRYFALGDTAFGSMAERTVIDLRRSIQLPVGVDPVQVAAGLNPAMSAWVALRRRHGFKAGQRVLVLGATGSSGQMAVQVAKLLGAEHVVAAGRNADKLAALSDIGADTAVQLGDYSAATEVDVVLDYLWGPVAAEALTTIAVNRRERTRPLTWIEIGSVAGPDAAIPSAALRALPLRIIGSGQGSVPTSEILAEMPAIVDAVSSGALRIDARPVPLADVSAAWRDSDSTARIVVTP